MSTKTVTIELRENKGDDWIRLIVKQDKRVVRDGQYMNRAQALSAAVSVINALAELEK